jgi:hypothetical protein
VAVEFNNDDILNWHGIVPGTQNTAVDDSMKNVAEKILNTENGNFEGAQ